MCVGVCSMSKLNGNQLLVRALEAQGVKKIFTIPGGQLVGLYDEIDKNKKLELVVPRQEGASALMACGYTLAGGQPGVVISTVGAGVIYELSGLIYAYQEQIPLISISPQIQSWKIKPTQESLQALDQDELYAPLVKFNAIIYHSHRIPQLIARAYRSALAPPPGPVHLDIPLDVFYQPFRAKNLKQGDFILPGEKTRFTGKFAPDPEELETARALLTKAKSPVAFLGSPLARLPGCSELLGEFLEKRQIPAFSSSSGFSALASGHRFFLGSMDTYEEERLISLLSEADLLICLEPDEEIIARVQKLIDLAKQIPMILLSEDPLLFQSFAPITAQLWGSVELSLKKLNQIMKESEIPSRSDWIEKLKAEKEKACQRVKEKYASFRHKNLIHTLEVVSKIIKEEDFVVCEGKEASALAKIYLKNYSPGRLVLLGEEAPLGSGFPLALGMKASNPELRVFLLTDRKNFKYHSRELQTQARYQLGICALVFPEKDKLAETEPDFSRLAQSLGVKGYTIQEPVEEINEKLFGEALELESGALLEIRGFQD